MSLRERTQFYLHNNVTFCNPRQSRRILLKYLDSDLKFVIHDTETNGLDPFTGECVMARRDGTTHKTWGARVFCHVLGIYDEDADHLYITYAHIEDTELLSLVSKYLTNPRIMKVGHNYKFDLQVCHVSGLDIQGPIYDTMSATRLTHDREPSHSLKWLGLKFAGLTQGKGKDQYDQWELPVKKWLDKARNAQSRAVAKDRKAKRLRPLTKDEKDTLKQRINYSAVPEDLMIPYAQSDIWYTFLLYIQTVDQMEGEFAELFALEMEIIRALIDMERRGCFIDRELCATAMDRLDYRLYLIREEMTRIEHAMGFESLNANSPQQLQDFVHALGFTDEDMYNKEGKVSTDAFVMDKLSKLRPDIDYIPLLLMHRACSKLRKTYFKKLYDKSVRNSVASCDFKASDTKNGRAACANPNLQNVPNMANPDKHPQLVKFMQGVPGVREVFRVRPGWKNFYFDYSQIEMRVFALFSQNADMIAMINQGVDLHSGAASLVFDEFDGADKDTKKRLRKQTKAIQFGIVYGLGIAKLAETLGITKEEASDLRKRYFKRLPAVQAFQQACTRRLYEIGYVDDMFGRQYHVPTDKAYQAVNALVQGASANVLKQALIQVRRLLKVLELGPDKINIILTIHDELVIEIHDSVPRYVIWLIKSVMETITPIAQHGVKIAVDIEYTKTNWGAKHDYDVTFDDVDSEVLPQRKRELRVNRALREFHKHEAEKVLSGLDMESITRYNYGVVDWFVN